MTSSLHLLGLQLIGLQFAKVKNASTKSLDVSLPPWLMNGNNIKRALIGCFLVMTGHY